MVLVDKALKNDLIGLERNELLKNFPFKFKERRREERNEREIPRM